MKITTTSGHTILADDEDAILLSQFSWYVVRTGDGRLYAQARVPVGMWPAGRVKMHRLLMQPPKGAVVHHRNNDGLDNRRSNLEVTTNRQNIRYHFEGKVTGVHFHKQSGKWRAQLRNEAGKFVSLGLHPTREAAVKATEAFKNVP